MNDYGLKKNAEGYTDPTAAATLNRKESGDIWEYKGCECLIIKGHPGFATILRLHEDNRYGDRVKVVERDGDPRYVDPAFIISGRYSEMGRYVETLDAVTFETVIIAVEAALQIDLRPVENAGPVHLDPLERAAEIQTLHEQLTAAREHMKTMEHLQNLKAAELTAANNAATKARNQLELLRDMYNELLAKAVGGGW